MNTTIDPNGRVRVVEDTGPDAKGNATSRAWECTAEQAGKHLARWTDPAAPAAAKISAGDVSAIQDAANQAAKQRGS